MEHLLAFKLDIDLLLLLSCVRCNSAQVTELRRLLQYVLVQFVVADEIVLAIVTIIQPLARALTALTVMLLALVAITAILWQSLNV